MKRIACALALLLAPLLASAAPALTPATLSYDVYWGGTPLGEGSLTLTASEGSDCYHYELSTRPVGIVRWIYGSPREVSDFCVVNNAVVPSRMQFDNPKRAKDGFVLNFDFSKLQVLGGRNGPLEITAGTLDRLSVQQAARLWVKAHVNDRKPGKMVVAIADHKRVKSYTFAITGRSKVSTPGGDFDAVRFERVDAPNSTLRFWLAPQKDYMPVKVENVEDGETRLSLTLQQGG